MDQWIWTNDIDFGAFLDLIGPIGPQNSKSMFILKGRRAQARPAVLWNPPLPHLHCPSQAAR